MTYLLITSLNNFFSSLNIRCLLDRLYTILLLEHEQLVMFYTRYEEYMTTVGVECKMVLLLTPSVTGVSVPGK